MLNFDWTCSLIKKKIIYVRELVPRESVWEKLHICTFENNSLKLVHPILLFFIEKRSKDAFWSTIWRSHKNFKICDNVVILMSRIVAKWLYLNISHLQIKLYVQLYPDAVIFISNVITHSSYTHESSNSYRCRAKSSGSSRAISRDNHSWTLFELDYISRQRHHCNWIQNTNTLITKLNFVQRYTIIIKRAFIFLVSFRSWNDHRIACEHDEEN